MTLKSDSETPTEVLQRVARDWNAAPIIVDKPHRQRWPALHDGETRNWPPIAGQRYVGEWPPRGLVTPQPRCAKGPTFELDSAQKAWLERYSEKYPHACNPWQLLTPREADARDARMLLSAEFVS